MSIHRGKGKKSTFFHGKNIPFTDTTRTPMTGEPNTNIDTYRKADGRLKQRRKIGTNGKAYVDLDVADCHKPYDHAHDIHDGVRTHSDRSLSLQEKREIDKAKKKRRFWHGKP